MKERERHQVAILMKILINKTEAITKCQGVTENFMEAEVKEVKW